MSYRNNFPHAEIIFSISSSDFIDFASSTVTRCSTRFSSMENFCHLINCQADKIAYARLANTFPAVFRDGARSHPNHMIEAACSGLALATREFVLRVRNDLLFKSEKFLEKYVDLYENFYQKGRYTVVDMPIMISSLFTLNPFSGVRLPFHYGDWFHFGLTKDVRELWNVPLVDLTFMTYYESNTCLSGTREKERNFFSRLAIEQYVHYEFLNKKIDGIFLSHHNDDRSIVESIEILIENFLLCDLYNLEIYFPKYNHGFIPYTDNNLRIIEEDWIVLSSDKSIDIPVYLDKGKFGARRYNPQRFPLLIGAQNLMSDVGFHFGRSIIIPGDAEGGIVCFGPYIGLFKGSYTATVEVSSLYPRQDDCYLVLKAAYNGGQSVLATAEFPRDHGNDAEDSAVFLQISFEQAEDRIDDFEIVLTSHGFYDMAIDRVVLEKTDGREAGPVPSTSKRSNPRVARLPGWSHATGKGRSPS